MPKREDGNPVHPASGLSRSSPRDLDDDDDDLQLFPQDG